MKSLLVSFVSVNKWPFSRISKYEKLLRIVECNYVHRRVDTDLWLDILQRSVLVISTKPDEEVGVAYDRQLREANITFLIKESFPVRGVVHDDVITYNKTMNERNGSMWILNDLMSRFSNLQQTCIESCWNCTKLFPHTYFTSSEAFRALVDIRHDYNHPACPNCRIALIGESQAIK